MALAYTCSHPLMDAAKQLEICQRYASKHGQDIRHVYTDTSLEFPSPWAGRPEGVLCQLAIQKGESVIIAEPAIVFAQGRSHFMQVVEYLELRGCQLLCANGYDIHGKYKGASDKAYIRYHDILTQIKLKPVYWNHGRATPPPGWRLTKRNEQPTLAPNYEERRLAEAVLDAYADSAISSSDLKLMLKRIAANPLKYARAASCGFPIAHPGRLVLGREITGMTYSLRRHVYDKIIAVLNGGPQTIRFLCDRIKAKYKRTMIYVLELVEMGYVIQQPVDQSGNVYSRNWQMNIPCEHWSLYSVEKSLRESPKTCGELSRELMYPRVNVKIALGMMAAAQPIRVKTASFKDKRAVWEWVGEPLNPEYVGHISNRLSNIIVGQNAKRRIRKVTS